MKRIGFALLLTVAGNLCAATPCPASAPTATSATPPVWDNSANCLLNGTYYFRYVQYTVGDASGDLAHAVAIYGNISFSSATGTYSIASGMELDSATAMPMPGTGQWQPSGFSATGNYFISASGQGFLTSPLHPGTPAGPGIPGDAIWVLLDQNLNMLGSSSQTLNDDQNDLFIAAPLTYGSYPPMPTNSTLSGSYTIDYMNFPNGYPEDALAVTFQINANGGGPLGQGTIGASSLISYDSAGSQGKAVGGTASYNFSNGAAVLGFPINSGLISSSSGLVPGLPVSTGNFGFLPGQEFLYISPDGNFVFGGAPGAWDMFVGVRTGSGGTTYAASFGGLYSQAGIDEDDSKLTVTTAGTQGYGSLDTYLGALNVTSGRIIDQQRILAPLSSPSYPGSLCASGSTCAYSYTFADSFTETAIAFGTSLAGTSSSPTSYTSSTTGYMYTVGASGKIRVGIGTGGVATGNKLGINVALPAYTAGSPGTPNPYIGATSAVNAFDYAPFTAGVSPGELIALFGSNFSSSIAVANIAAPGLNGVHVMINGIDSPVIYVSPGQIDALVPYGIATPSTQIVPYAPYPVILVPGASSEPVTSQTQVSPSAQIQVTSASGLTSNVVTQLVNYTTPGLWTVSGTGFGDVVGYDLTSAGISSLVSKSSCAYPGDTVALYMTGLGGLNPIVVNDAITYTASAFAATINGAPATVQSAVPLTSSPGLYQVDMTIPTTMNLTGQIDAPIVITGPDSEIAGATIWVAPKNTPCVAQ